MEFAHPTQDQTLHLKVLPWQATKAQRVSRGIALPFHDLGAEDGGVGLAPRPGRCTPGKNTVPIVQEAGWAPGTVWTGVENLATTGIRSPDRPARSQSLYRLCYPEMLHLSG